MSWECPNCERRYPESRMGVSMDADADEKDGCKVCFASPPGIGRFIPPSEAGQHRLAGALPEEQPAPAPWVADGSETESRVETEGSE